MPIGIRTVTPYALDLYFKYVIKYSLPNLTPIVFLKLPKTSTKLY